MKTKLVLGAVVLPLLVIVGGIVRAEVELAKGTPWVFDVAGYDPRDLLRGRYLQFRLDLHEEEPNDACDSAAGQDCCYCLSRTEPDAPPRAEATQCTIAVRDCDGALKIAEVQKLRRYYVPEARASELEAKLREAEGRDAARLRLRIDREGNPRIDGLLVDGEMITNAP
jgi:uncharacterized membrane-anchored protein